MFVKSSLTAAALSLLMSSPVWAEFSTTCQGTTVAIENDTPMLKASCRTNAPTPDWPTAFADASLDLTKDGHIKWDGGAFYPQVKELGYSLEIQDGYTLSMYTARFSGEHDSHGSWDLDLIIKNDNGVLKFNADP